MCFCKPLVLDKLDMEQMERRDQLQIVTTALINGFFLCGCSRFAPATVRRSCKNTNNIKRETKHARGTCKPSDGIHGLVPFRQSKHSTSLYSEILLALAFLQHFVTSRVPTSPLVIRTSHGDDRGLELRGQPEQAGYPRCRGTTIR